MELFSGVSTIANSFLALSLIGIPLDTQFSVIHDVTSARGFSYILGILLRLMCKWFVCPGCVAMCI